VPAEGEEVEIKSGWHMVFDLEESPILKSLQINGILSFSNTTNTHLRAKHIFVRAGQLLIGTADYPM